MRSAALLLGLFTTLLAAWPWSLMPADACALFDEEIVCSAGSCCAMEDATTPPRTPCDPEERPCACDPFMACSGCACPMPTLPLTVVAVLPMYMQGFAPHTATLLDPELEEAWHPPNAVARWA